MGAAEGHAAGIRQGHRRQGTQIAAPGEGPPQRAVEHEVGDGGDPGIVLGPGVAVLDHLQVVPGAALAAAIDMVDVLLQHLRRHVLGGIETEAVDAQAEQPVEVVLLDPLHVGREHQIRQAAEPAAELGITVAVVVAAAAWHPAVAVTAGAPQGGSGESVEIGPPQTREAERVLPLRPAIEVGHVVEHHIGDHPHPAAMGAADQQTQILLRAQAGDDALVDRLVAPGPAHRGGEGTGVGLLGRGDLHVRPALLPPAANRFLHLPEGQIEGVQDRSGLLAGRYPRRQGQGHEHRQSDRQSPAEPHRRHGLRKAMAGQGPAVHEPPQSWWSNRSMRRSGMSHTTGISASIAREETSFRPLRCPYPAAARPAPAP